MMNGGVTDEAAAEVLGVVWVVQAGSEGRWRNASEEYSQRGDAVERLEWFRLHAPRSISYRLIRMTTTLVTDVEDA
ncbi:hypothetical protein ABZ743_32820 [Streptomyces sp. NPDC006662]|uniref:hypothetical protein n=1 Tax=Streptomyces sp. NPDC006662 TaxID=3156902 RepID=UPI0033F2E116